MFISVCYFDEQRLTQDKRGPVKKGHYVGRPYFDGRKPGRLSPAMGYSNDTQILLKNALELRKFAFAFENSKNKDIFIPL